MGRLARRGFRCRGGSPRRFNVGPCGGGFCRLGRPGDLCHNSRRGHDRGPQWSISDDVSWVGRADYRLDVCRWNAGAWFPHYSCAWRLTIVGGGREAWSVWRRGRLETVCAPVAWPALLRGPSTSPLEGQNGPSESHDRHRVLPTYVCGPGSNCPWGPPNDLRRGKHLPRR